MMFQQSGPSSGSSSSSGLFQPPFGAGDTKVFVGGLAWETQSETMRQYFQQFGDILEAVVISDKNTARSKGYGFVTFQDPESARRACVDPAPIIDGRRANCNLASLGRPRHALPFVGSIRPPTLFPVRGPYFASHGYQQPPVPYNCQPGLTYPPYTYGTYGPEHVYPQGIYNPYAGQQYLHMYGVPGTFNTQGFPYNQISQVAPNGHGYTPFHSYTLPGQPIVQFGGPNINGIPTPSIQTIQTPYPAGIATPIPGQHFIVPASPQFIQGGGTGQNVG